MPAMWSVPTEATLVPRAIFHFALWINVQERTLLVVAGIESRVEVTLRHLGHVVLMQKLTLIPLLAETAQPVLTHDGPVTSYVSKRTGTSFITLLTIFCDEIADCGYGFVHSIEWKRDGAHLLNEVPLCLELQAVDVG